MGRGRQLRRTLRLVQLLARPEGVSVGEAARELNCTPRTIYRDLGSLQELEYPLYKDDDGAGQVWKLMDGFRYRHQIPFTHEELCALWLAQDALGALQGTAFGSAACSALQKVRATLARPVREKLEKARAFWAVTPAGRDYSGRSAIADSVRRAAEERRTLSILYEPLAGKRRRQLVDPYLMWLDPSNGGLYWAGWAHDRREVRTFLVDRVREADLTERSFAPVPGWDAGAYLAAAFAAYQGRPAPVRLLFFGRAARLVGERKWHPSQTLRPRPGGAVELEMKVPMSPALVGWVMGWCPEVRVLGPQSLATAVREALRRGLARQAAPEAAEEPRSLGRALTSPVTRAR